MPNTPAEKSTPDWETRYRRKQAHRGRGLADLEERVGDVCAEIDQRLAGQASVRLLELGCGYAIALLDLVARYGARVEVCGINLREDDGQGEILRREARARGIDLDAVPAMRPTLVHGDVAQGLLFTDDSFDLVVSQVAWRYFRNKVGVLRDVVRVLRADGVGLIDADEFDVKLPREYGRLVEIWDRQALVPFGNYVARFGMSFVPVPRGRALRIVKATSFGKDLVPRLEIDMQAIDAHWDGIKCIYAPRESEE